MLFQSSLEVTRIFLKTQTWLFGNILENLIITYVMIMSKLRFSSKITNLSYSRGLEAQGNKSI